MERLLWVCFGGAIGSGARYLIGLWAQRTLGAGFPYGTLLVNVAGCFLIAGVMTAGRLPPTLQIAITTGFLGGLTTYSSFNFETTELYRSGNGKIALANLGITLVACAVAGLAGMWLARKLFAAP
jgi:fluoride exporter